MNITAKVNDRNDISQANRKLLSISQGIKLSKQIILLQRIFSNDCTLSGIHETQALLAIKKFPSCTAQLNVQVFACRKKDQWQRF